MTRDQLRQAFKRAQDRAREAWSADEVVKIIEELEAVTWDYLAVPEDFGIEEP